MKHLGVETMPGVPDFNQSTIAMGQHLLNPPSVAGWAGGKAWITPGLLIARGNVARDVLIPDMTGFRDWNFSAGTDDVLGQRLRDGYDIGAATAVNDPAKMTAFDRVALERDEKFNTRISGYIGWEQAARKLIPTPRDAARFDLTEMVLASGAKTTAEAVDYLARADAARPGGEGDARRIGRVPHEGIGDGQPRPRQDLHGRRAANDGAPVDEHARVSDRLGPRRARRASALASAESGC